MQTSQSHEPLNPSLRSCIIVDSRFSSRQEIRSEISASGMYQEIIEAHSLTHGIELLRASEMDSCFIGPSVSTGKAADFITAGRRVSASQSCAFVVIRESDFEPVDALKRAGAHGVLHRPYSKRSFSEEISSSITKANNQNVWGAMVERIL